MAVETRALSSKDGRRGHPKSASRSVGPSTLAVKGGTNYPEAVNITEARKQSCRDGGIAYYRSLAYFLTDG